MGLLLTVLFWIVGLILGLPLAIILAVVLLYTIIMLGYAIIIFIVGIACIPIAFV